ncbi:MAG: hypothetical protein IT459_06715 [Planctomycetes bacterium]|nr:hypothetical protein [Planctomycetota bacterium]
MILRSDEPTDEQILSMRALDPLLARLVEMPVTSARMAVELVVLSIRMERALRHKCWRDADQLVAEVEAFVRRYEGGVA